MKKIILIFNYLTIFVFMFSCTHKDKPELTDNEGLGMPGLEVSYAQNFRVTSCNPHLSLLTIQNAQGKHSQVFKYALYDQENIPDSIPQGFIPLHIPVTNIICMTSLQLSNFIALDATQCVKGITSTRHLFNPQMQTQLQNIETLQIGIEGNFDNEVILSLNPELILISPSKRGGYESLQESGLPLMPHLGYQEPHPLGQAEWIRLVGLLTGRQKQADELFDTIAYHYNSLKERIPREVNRPTVMSGDMKGGNWYATGGRSFLAQIINDAGARYFMQDDENTGGVNIDFETVYAQGAESDYWRVSNSFDGDFNYEELGKQDSRFRDFKAFRNHTVIYCNMSRTPFYESFPVRPDLVLADFVSIFHPEVIPEHKPVYYSVLK